MQHGGEWLPCFACRSYEHFCACGKMLDERLEALGAQRFVPRTDVNR
jgi:sulfite reductase alpha subunit-like flavoprotein